MIGQQVFTISRPATQPTSLLGRSGLAGVSQGKLIPFQPFLDFLAGLHSEGLK